MTSATWAGGPDLDGAGETGTRAGESGNAGGSAGVAQVPEQKKQRYIKSYTDYDSATRMRRMDMDSGH
jgi:hypothetical protein